MPTSSKLKLQKSIKTADSRKVSKVNQISGLLGIIMGGAKRVDVPGRSGFVYVRLRDNPNELIQAFNDKVSQVYDLPVLLERDANLQSVWRVVGRDIGRYSEWQSSYIPRHANQHSFSGKAGAGGDVVWVYGNQFMPLLAHPSGTAGANNVVIEAFTYYYQGAWKYGGGTGTADILAYKPTGSNARMVLAYLDGNSNPALAASDTYFDATTTGALNIVPYLPPLPETSGIPLAGVRLVSGTSKILWSNLYDLRPLIASSGFIPTGTYGHIIQENGVQLPHQPILNFAGNAVWVENDGVNNRTNISISGTSGGSGAVGHIIEDDGTPLPAQANLNFVGGGVWAVDNVDTTDVIISGSNQFASLAESQAGVVESKVISPNTLPLWVLGDALVRRDGYSGNARGQYSVDLQRVRGNVTQIAGGYADSIGGGEYNKIGPDSLDGVIAGGYANEIYDYESAIVGGNANKIDYGDGDNFIGGGYRNIISGSYYGVVAGGYRNKVNSGKSAILGGANNVIYPGSDDSVIGGGSGNQIIGEKSFIGGGSANYISGSYSVIVGGDTNKVVGTHSTAYGYGSFVTHDGTTVFSDGFAAVYPSLYANEFAIRATGGFRVNTQTDGSGVPISTGTFSYKDGTASVGGNLDVANRSRLGGTDNCVDISLGGELKLRGTATRYLDENGQLSSAKITSPSSRIVQDEAESAYYYKDTCDLNDYLWVNIQLNHDRKLSAPLFPHLHWWQSQAGVPNWLMQYRYQTQGSLKSATWTSIPYDSNAYTYVTGTLNQITAFPELLPPPNDGVSDVVQIRILRDVANTTALFSGSSVVAGNAYVYDFDLHKEIDDMGSAMEYIK